MRRDDGGTFLYEVWRQKKEGQPKVVLVRQADGFVAEFTPDRIVQLFVEPSAAESRLAKRLYDRCMEVYRALVESRNRSYLRKHGIREPSDVTWEPAAGKQRWCHECKALIAPAWHFRCARCGWNVCKKCGSCGEGYVRKPENPLW
jgi:hypothetical protein